MFKTPIAIACAALTFVGCAFEDGYEPVGEGTLYSRLGTRETLALERTSLVGVVASDRDGNPLPCMQPTVTSGSAVLRSTDTGLLLVEDLEIELSDMQVEPGVIHSEAIDLTDIRLQLGTQIAIEPDWNSGDGLRVEGSGRADLLLGWSVLSDSGEVYPLATQRLRDAEFQVQVGLENDSSVTATVTTAVEGRLGSFANRIELSDFSMAVNASSTHVDID